METTDNITHFIRTLAKPSQRTKDNYEWALNYFAAKMQDFTDETYKEFFEDVINDLSPSTKRVFKAALAQYYDYFEIGSPARRNRVNEHSIPKGKSKRINIKKPSIEKLLTHCESLGGDLISLRDRAFVLFLADSGFRISEACDLDRGSIDYDERRALVTGKGGETTIIRLSDRSINAIRDYLAVRAKLDGASGKPLASLPLFAQHGKAAGNKVKRITNDGMRLSIKLRMTEADIEPGEIRIHDLRHYFVTMVVMTTGNIMLASELARHKSTAVTSSYAHLGKEYLDAAYHDIFNARK